MPFHINRHSSEWTLIAGLALVLAVLFAGAGIFVYQKNRIFAASAQPTMAEVIEVTKETIETERPSETRLVPVFQYKVEGAVFESRETREGRSGAAAAARGDTTYSVGDTTTIYFNPENPSEIREVLAPDANRAPTIFSVLSGLAWITFAISVLRATRSLRDAAVKTNQAATTETRCRFIALEGTRGHGDDSRMIRLVCRWIHPETGVEWLLRSPNVSPEKIPADLKLGTMIPCKIDFDDPTRYEILLDQLGATPTVTARQETTLHRAGLRPRSSG